MENKYDERKQSSFWQLLAAPDESLCLSFVLNVRAGRKRMSSHARRLLLTENARTPNQPHDNFSTPAPNVIQTLTPIRFSIFIENRSHRWTGFSIHLYFQSVINTWLLRTLWGWHWQCSQIMIETQPLSTCLNAVRLTCREGTSWGVQNLHKSSHRWAHRRCRSSVCLQYSWAWSKSWGWQNKASPWCIHWHTPKHLFPRPLWWMLQRVILFLWCNWICHKSSHFTLYHFSSTAASPLLKCNLWSRKTKRLKQFWETKHGFTEGAQPQLVSGRLVFTSSGKCVDFKI